MALNSGYNMIDTASFYKNEEGVGKGLALSGKKEKKYFLQVNYGMMTMDMTIRLVHLRNL